MKVRPLFLGLLTVFGLGGFVTCFSNARATPADATLDDPSGMVWERHGDWHLNWSAAVLRLGEAIPPGGLLTAGTVASAHSMTVLLPDGQRMLCECYEMKTCSQGFRVPAITPLPTPGAWDMFVAVRNVLLLRSPSSETALPVVTGRAALAGNFEMVAAVNPQGEVSIAGSLRVLPSGQYSLSVAQDGPQASGPALASAQPLAWTAGQKTAAVKIDREGLYRIRIGDQTSVSRIYVEVLVTPPDRLAAETAALKHARETVLGWNETHGGWSLHDFLRVYLQAREKEMLR
jgi:hypothetical protein